ncbi:MAG: PhoX family phosphatase [Pseudomonadota bacterium]
MREHDTVSNPTVGSSDPLDEVLQRRISRRALLGRGLVLGVGASTPGLGGCAGQSAAGAVGSGDDGAGSRGQLPGFRFDEIQRGSDGYHHVPEGYSAQVLIRWGDALFPDAAVFDPLQQSAEAQKKQFGYNCDFIGYYPLPEGESDMSRALLCVNHEYTSSVLMFPNVSAGFPGSMTKDLCDIEMVAHGGSVVEIVLQGGRWQVNLASPLNRRIFGYGTPMAYSGPAAGHHRLSTSADPSGVNGTGTFNNCAGGVTPWGTYLMAEENFHGYFQGSMDEEQPEAENHKRYGVPGGWFQWGRYYNEFDINKEPNGPNRYGWIVEVDLLDPQSKPRKRTAMGRFKHEGAESVIAPDGRLVVYMGDDERFEYVYKFVTKDRVDPDDRVANQSLLDHGTLYVGKFHDDGRLDWLPLEYGSGPLTKSNGFSSQADVVIEARRAADLLGATPMDRPEDVEAQPGTGRAYVMLTNNSLRAPDQLNAVNTRARNMVGHIVEIQNPGGDHASERSTWDILVQCGDPADPEAAATWNAATSDNGWFGSPDNCAFDAAGRLWVSTDGNPVTGAADGLWAIDTDGPRRGTGTAFFRAPVGAEVCGPRFAPDGKTLFLAIQHPGDGRQATFENPTTRWPDFQENMPPRPSVVSIKADDGNVIGG